ncbi:RNA 3'-terminal phosphate cyclase, putative [Talaromyces stipitatus ATCC 10500]|uniref:RNA 3'-terminal phosphate cyclase, putative n=1 Tax=Talaromyces stipitatus (strain ATCC 10500 / CBS 375.48 / QM 6759 / NRRL 1006) TaxID=441959 RepID=B8MR29_TALSN|nr:RNA 3'-terminal phosphate cyclase, putative [Talaromyces stipitatus ATCC 10500]EED12924.1 RNA 3'-terminal phosphate cyclase, putative [Talaromyces stipitatus ATCC 10500]
MSVNDMLDKIAMVMSGQTSEHFFTKGTKSAEVNMAPGYDRHGKPSSVTNPASLDGPITIIHIDGRMLEGGGQLVRNVVALSALTGLPITIDNIRGNRQGKTGLKGSHAAAIGFIAGICQGEVVDGHVGSQRMTFYPRKREFYHSHDRSEPNQISPAPQQTKLFNSDVPPIKPEYKIHQHTAGSISLVFQALYPYLVYASSLSSMDTKEPVRVHITGGTNVTFSPSFDYINQVLVPNLRTLGLPKLNVRLHKRGWSTGPKDLGSVTFDVYPLEPLESHWFPILKLHEYRRTEVTWVNITILAPDINIQDREAHGSRHDRRKIKHEKHHTYDSDMYSHWTIREYLEDQCEKSLRKALKGLNNKRPSGDGDESTSEPTIQRHLSEATHHHTHIYILLVAHMSNGLILGTDALFDGYEKRDSRKNRNRDNSDNTIATLDNLVDSCVGRLVEELDGSKRDDGNGNAGYHPVVDVHMRDQLVIFEALGLVNRSVERNESSVGSDVEDQRYWSLHTRTARWVCEQILGQDIWNA